MTDYLDQVSARITVVNDILGERERQDKKWGEQNHPDISPRIRWEANPAVHTTRVARYYGVLTADEARGQCDNEHKRDKGSWFTIHIEELGEALEAAGRGDTVALRTELVQLAATVTAHIEAIDRRN